MEMETKIKLLAAVIALAGLLFGIFEFVKVREVEARLPYLQKKLEWCEAAVRQSSKIAMSETPSETDIRQFREMYWGVMGLIEKETITDAMIAFDNALKDSLPSVDGSKGDPTKGESIQKRSLDLAHACRHELSVEWSPSWGRGQ